MKIIVDAMGGDNAPDEIIEGALLAIEKFGIDIVFTGRGEDILRVFEKLGHSDIPGSVQIVNASEVIGIDEDPASAIRVKKDSSLTVALNLLKDGGGDALVSAGSTGALLSGATLIVKRVRGIRRAALAPVIPCKGGSFVLIDCGANSECSPEYLLQFAYMGSFYSEDVLKVRSPRVGLLNNGSERSKGTPLQIETYEILEKASLSGRLNFVGNVEAGDVMRGVCDVLVCDGFTGNIFLKSLEGMAEMIMSELKGVFLSSVKTKLSALLIKKRMSGLKQKLSADAIGGTPLLGISKPVIKAHGSSNKTAISNAIFQAIASANVNIAGKLSENISQMKMS